MVHGPKHSNVQNIGGENVFEHMSGVGVCNASNSSSSSKCIYIYIFDSLRDTPPAQQKVARLPGRFPVPLSAGSWNLSCVKAFEC